MVNSGCSYVGCCEGNCFPPEFLPRLLAANQAGRFPFHDLIKTYAAKEMGQVIDDIHSGKTVKAVLLWD